MRIISSGGLAPPAIRTIVTFASWTHGSCLPYSIGSAGSRSHYLGVPSTASMLFFQAFMVVQLASVSCLKPPTAHAGMAQATIQEV